MSLWIKAIINHLWWCCASLVSNEELIREKWLSMFYHIQGIHSWETQTTEPRMEIAQNQVTIIFSFKKCGRKLEDFRGHKLSH